MKTFLIIIFLLLYSFPSFCQNEKKKKNDEYFVVLYTVGINWDTTKQAYQQNYFQDHSEHLAELRKSKKISIGGRYSDTGMILLKAKDISEAENLIHKDKAIQNKIFQVEIFAFDPFYTGCLK